MEHNKTGLSTYEAPTESSDEPKKTKDKASKKVVGTEKSDKASIDRKQQAEQRLSRALDASPLFEQVDDKEPVAETNEILEAEDASYASQEIANEHLNAIEGADAETQAQLELAEEFLERVADGQDIEIAFNEVAAEHGFDEADVAEVVDVDDGEEYDGAEQPIEVNNEVSINLHQQPPAAHGAGGGNRSDGPVGNVAPGSAPQPDPNKLPDAADTYYHAQTRQRDLLVGGIIGYLIGRHRGRVKAEKRLLPIQSQLEKQVGRLERVITIKEQQLTKLQANNTKLRRSEVASTAKLRERMQPGLQETRLGMQKPARAEQLGHMIISAETPRVITETKLERPGNIRAAYRAEEVKTMDRHQLLELSEKITVEGASLRHIYQSNLIGERQLRHLVSEYLQGHDIRDELRRHIVEREIDFERDPIMRDRIRGKAGPVSGGGSALQDMLTNAGLGDNAADPAFEHRVKTDDKRRAAEQQRAHRQRAATDVAMATAIVTLAVAVIVLVARG